MNPEQTAVPADLAFLQWLIDECGYAHPRPIGSGRYAALRPMLFTTAIITGRIGDRTSVDDHWCYETPAEALVALMLWDGTGEPQGWLRHPRTGRRRSRDPDERDATGEPVGAVGRLYTRG